MAVNHKHAWIRYQMEKRHYICTICGARGLKGPKLNPYESPKEKHNRIVELFWSKRFQAWRFSEEDCQ